MQLQLQLKLSLQLPKSQQNIADKISEWGKRAHRQRQTDGQTDKAEDIMPQIKCVASQRSSVCCSFYKYLFDTLASMCYDYPIKFGNI